MREHPILFSSPLVQALLSGQKTVTRRMPKQWLKVKAGDRLWVRETWGCPVADHPKCKGGRKPQPGDRIVYAANPADAYQWQTGHPGCASFCWRPSIHMPRWVSRINLESTEDARLERLWDITEEEAQAEGFDTMECFSVFPDQYGFRHQSRTTWSKRCHPTQEGFPCAKRTFSEIWSELYTKPGERWEDNPAVVRVAFRKGAQ